MDTSKQRGFTLLEVMIVVVIVAGLLLIAVPLYQDQILKTRRTDAMAGLQDLASRQEKFLLDRSTYVWVADLSSIGWPTTSPEEWYDLSITPEAADCDLINCYELVATPASGSPQEDDEECTSFTLKSSGAKEATGTRSDECW